MYVANYGIPNAELQPAGRRMLDAAGRPEGDPDFAFAYGAQAAEILLDAIARSDGTRPSVTRARCAQRTSRKASSATSASTSTATSSRDP